MVSEVELPALGMDGSDCKSSTVADTVVTLVSRVVRAVFREVINARISYNTSLMPTHLVCAQLLWRPSHSSAGSPSLSVLASRITVVHTKQISPVEQLAGVARASGTVSGVALTRTGVPGGFTRSPFVALSFVVFVVFGMVYIF